MVALEDMVRSAPANSAQRKPYTSLRDYPVLAEADAITEAHQRHLNHEELMKKIAPGTIEIMFKPVSYDTPKNEHYEVFDPYHARFVGLQPVESGTRAFLGTSAGLMGYNFTNEAKITLVWDEILRQGYTISGTSNHEHNHNGEHRKNHNNAEQWNRAIDHDMHQRVIQKTAHGAPYVLQYRFTQ